LMKNIILYYNLYKINCFIIKLALNWKQSKQKK